MNQQEFKALDNDFIEALRKELPDNNIKVVNHPFHGKVIGIAYDKTNTMYELYSLTNNGDVAEYKFLGQGQL